MYDRRLECRFKTTGSGRRVIVFSGRPLFCSCAWPTVRIVYSVLQNHWTVWRSCATGTLTKPENKLRKELRNRRGDYPFQIPHPHCQLPTPTVVSAWASVLFGCLDQTALVQLWARRSPLPSQQHGQRDRNVPHARMISSSVYGYLLVMFCWVDVICYVLLIQYHCLIIIVMHSVTSELTSVLGRMTGEVHRYSRGCWCRLSSAPKSAGGGPRF